MSDLAERLLGSNALTADDRADAARELREQVTAWAGHPNRADTWEAVLAALPAVAAYHGVPWTDDAVFRCAVRTVAERAGRSRQAVQKALAQMIAAGLLIVWAEDNGPEARILRTTPALADLAALARCATPDHYGEPVDNPLNADTPSSVTLSVQRLHTPPDATRYGGLSRRHRHALDVLDAGPATAAELAAALGCHRTTAGRMLARLQGWGLVVARAGRWMLARAGAALAAGGRKARAVLRGIARRAGLKDRGAAQVRRHRDERDSFRRWWEEEGQRKSKRYAPPPDEGPPLHVYDRYAPAERAA